MGMALSIIGDALRSFRMRNFRVHLAPMKQLNVLTVLVGLLWISATCSSPQESTPEVDPGPGPCYATSVDDQIIFGCQPQFSEKGRSQLDEIEKDAKLPVLFQVGFFDDTSGQRCRTLDFTFETTGEAQFLMLDTSGQMVELMKRVFAVYLSECTNTEDYTDVFLNFMLGTNERYEEFLDEERFFLTLYRDSAY